MPRQEYSLRPTARVTSRPEPATTNCTQPNSYRVQTAQPASDSDSQVPAAAIDTVPHFPSSCSPRSEGLGLTAPSSQLAGAANADGSRLALDSTGCLQHSFPWQQRLPPHPGAAIHHQCVPRHKACAKAHKFAEMVQQAADCLQELGSLLLADIL